MCPHFHHLLLKSKSLPAPLLESREMALAPQTAGPTGGTSRPEGTEATSLTKSCGAEHPSSPSPSHSVLDPLWPLGSCPRSRAGCNGSEWRAGLRVHRTFWRQNRQAGQDPCGEERKDGDGVGREMPARVSVQGGMVGHLPHRPAPQGQSPRSCSAWELGHFWQPMATISTAPATVCLELCTDVRTE